MKKFSVGIDPDLHTLCVALVSAQEGKAALEGVWTMKVKGATKEDAVADMVEAMLPWTKSCDFFTVESQCVTYTGKTNAARPQDLIYLAQVAGACLAMAQGGSAIIIPPVIWKKTMPKKIVQGRCFKALGLEYRVRGGNKPYCVPVDFERFDRTGNLNSGDWVDAGDSVSLAYWRLKEAGLV